MNDDRHNELKRLVRTAFEKAVEIVDLNPSMLVPESKGETLFKEAYEQTLYLVRNPSLRTALVDDFTAANLNNKDEMSFEEFIRLMTQALDGIPDEDNAIEAAQVLIHSLDEHIKNKPMPSHRLN